MKASPDQVLAATAGVAITLGVGLLLLAYEVARYFMPPPDLAAQRDQMRADLFQARDD